MSIQSNSFEQINALCDKDLKTDGQKDIPKTSNKTVENEKTNDIDFLLENYIGGGGWGQWLILICQYPIGMASGLPILIQMFAAFEPRHRCFVPTCDDSETTKNIAEAEFVQHAFPKEYGSSEMFREDESFDPCRRYELLNETLGLGQETCSAASFQNATAVKCDAYVYDTSVFTETLTTKFDLVCDNESRRRLLGTLMMLGLLIGSLIGGRLSDRFGRKITMLISQLILTPVVMFGGFAPNYATYAVLRLISATCLPPMWICGHSLTLELFGKEYRRSVVMAKDFVSPFSQLILVLIIYTTRHWKYIHLWTGLACLVPLPCYFFVPESPRWLTINGHLEHAERILLTVAKRNKKKLSEEERHIIRNTLASIEKDANKVQGQENLNPLDMLRSGHLTKTLILMFNWVTVCVGSYTLVLNSTKLYGDVFINYTLVVLAGEIPGTISLLITLRLFGRRFNLFYTQLILGMFKNPWVTMTAQSCLITLRCVILLKFYYRLLLRYLGVFAKILQYRNNMCFPNWKMFFWSMLPNGMAHHC